jgi:DNA processing protein
LQGFSEASLHCLALHLAGRTLTDKNRRLLEVARSLPRLAQILLANQLKQFLHLAEEILHRLAGDSVVTLADSDYPQLLQEISTAPFALFLRGNRQLIATEKVSIVGTREPSAAGRIAAKNVAAYFSAKGRVIVSGIARGIDAVVHHAALQAGGATIAVLPNGFNHLYPLENRDIYALSGTSDRILLLSEYAPEEKPQRYQFVRRNRIIAGLSPTTVVIEAGMKSGAMITVNHALEAGRDVAALSHVSLTNNAGGEKLVADGAIDLTALAFEAKVRERII